MTIQSYFYNAEGRDREIPIGDVSIDKLGGENLLWIDVCDPSPADCKNVAALLNITPEALENEPRTRSRLDNYGEFFSFSVQGAPSQPIETEDARTGRRERKGDLEAGAITEGVQIGFLVAEGWLVTIHDGDVPFLQRFREQDKAETLIGLLTGQSLAASLLDWHLGEYFQEVSAIEAAADTLDERVLRETAGRSLLGRMAALKRRVSRLRAALVAQRDVFYGLSRPDFVLITESGAMPFYEGLVSRFERAVDEVERTRGVVVGSFELFTSRTSQQTNDLVKVLTFLTAIVGFCAAIAGLMGMNFKLAFFETGLWGFGLVTGGLVVVALGSVGYARFRKWI